MLLPALLTGAWVASPAAKRAMRLLMDAMQRRNVARKVAALTMQISESQLSDQMAMRQPMHKGRLDDLFESYPELGDEYFAAELERRGYRVLRDRTLLQLIDEVHTLTAWATMEENARPVSRVNTPMRTDRSERER